MTIHCESLVLCERVISDALTGNLTLVSCIDRIQAIQFPAVHHGFAVTARFCWKGPPSSDEVPVRFRLCRISAADGEEVVATTAPRPWQPGAPCSRWSQSFGVLRLRRAESLTFRVDHAVGDGDWVAGATSSIEVSLMEMPEDQRARLIADLERVGALAPVRAPSS